MHIALVHHHVGGPAGGGGGVRLMLELGSALSERGHQITIACHDYLPGGEFSYIADRLEIRSVRTGISELPAGNVALARRFWLEMPKVARLVPADADVVNAHEWLALRPGRIAAGRLSVPLVWTRNDESLWERAIVPDDTIHGDPELSRRVLRAAVTWPDLLDARRASTIAVLSAHQVEMVRRSYHRPSLLADDPQVHALIAGSDHVDPAYADRLAERIAARDLGDRVALPRRGLSDAEMKDTYVAADVFVILSQRYAWGLAPLEAIASGTPVILTPGAGVYDILAGRPGVQVVPAQDPLATAEAIRRWRTGAGREGIESTRAWLREEYAFDRYVTRMEQIYADVAGAQRR